MNKIKFRKLYKTLYPTHHGILEDFIRSLPLGYEDEVYYWLEEFNISEEFI
jgi:hypothetical protein